jgi:hypothetical protein
MGMETMNLSDIGNGALEELFQHELKKVLHNIADVNCDPEKERAITITFTFKPSINRTTAAIGVKIGSKTVSTEGFRADAFLGNDKDGQLACFAINPNQQTLFPKPDASIIGIVDSTETEEVEG